VTGARRAGPRGQGKSPALLDNGRVEHPGTEEDPARPGDSLPLRNAGRVIVLDPDDRVLLFFYDEPPPNGRHWCTPGGGLDAGEDYPTGARRELEEETGWKDVALGDEVHRGTRTIEFPFGMRRQHERFFLARTGPACRELGDVAAMHASDGITGWRWWTLGELDATSEVVWPTGLADLIREALAG
jgi:ADP-ribose pyrophosphatase YjhB (NUDIX family)